MDVNKTNKIPLYTWYDANYDQELVEWRRQTAHLCWQYNQLDPLDATGQETLLRKIFHVEGESVTILPPVQADYGSLTTIQEGTWINSGAIFLDGGTVTIGKHCFIGPMCQFYTAHHALQASERNQGLETAAPIVLEDNVWLGGDVTILPGVTIHEGAVIGAKSLVNKDIPAGVIAAGVPARVIRKITEQDAVHPITIL